MKFIIATIFFASVSVISAQRGSYAGSSPIVSGLRQPFDDNLGNRQNSVQPLNSNTFQQPQQQTPQFFPQNNANLADRINQLPPSNQPFWFLNQHAINAHLNQPQPGFGGIAQGGFGAPPNSLFQPGTFVAGR